MKRNIYIFTFVLFLQSLQFASAQAPLTFSNLDSLLGYATQNSVVLKNSTLQTQLSDWQKKSAKIGLVNFKMQTSFSLIDNILLPVTFLPGEAFGGAPGSFKEVTTGQPYISNLTIAPQIDIVNPANWSKLKSADINIELTEINNLITEKTHFESIAAAYYNIISLQEQINIAALNLISSDSLLLIVNGKYAQGLVRKQDLNDVTISKINLLGKAEQLKIMLAQQYLGLKILCDIPPNTELIIADKLDYESNFDLSMRTDNQLTYKVSLLKIEQLNTDLKINKMSQLPSLSLVGYSAWQQNSSVTFFDADRDWINSQYIGLKLNIPFPDVNKYMLSKSIEINREISQMNSEHTKLSNDMNNMQMTLDYEKALSQLSTAKEVFNLKEENYKMANEQYKMGVLPTDKLLISFNDLLASQVEYSNALALLQFQKSKITINNKIK